jgi:hypothetical protein
MNLNAEQFNAFIISPVLWYPFYLLVAIVVTAMAKRYYDKHFKGNDNE